MSIRARHIYDAIKCYKYRLISISAGLVFSLGEKEHKFCLSDEVLHNFCLFAPGIVSGKFEHKISVSNQGQDLFCRKVPIMFLWKDQVKCGGFEIQEKKILPRLIKIHWKDLENLYVFSFVRYLRISPAGTGEVKKCQCCMEVSVV